MSGTLAGALILAALRDGMNQVGVPPNPQMIVMVAVILAAVLTDQARLGKVTRPHAHVPRLVEASTT